MKPGFEGSLEQQHHRILRASALKTPIESNVHRSRKPVCVGRWVWIVMLTLSGWICCANVQAADVEEPFRVMILRNTSQYLPAGILQDRGMREAFAAKGPGKVEFFVETMDTMWFDRSEIEPEFLSLFRKKYGSRKIDLLMAAGADALDFAQRFREVLLPGVPIVFYNVAEDALRGRGLQPGITGVVLRFNLPGTLDLAVRLQPDARRIVVVSGTSAYDRNWLRRAREALRAYEGRLEVVLLVRPTASTASRKFTAAARRRDCALSCRLWRWRRTHLLACRYSETDCCGISGSRLWSFGDLSRTRDCRRCVSKLRSSWKASGRGGSKGAGR